MDEVIRHVFYIPGREFQENLALTGLLDTLVNKFDTGPILADDAVEALLEEVGGVLAYVVGKVKHTLRVDLDDKNVEQEAKEARQRKHGD